LAENALFAERCEKAGLIFVGPSARVIRELGDKTVARRMMASSGVPVIPGMLEATTDPQRLRHEAAEIGFPVLVKAAAGGGGKGMRIVREPETMEESCLSASSEAEKAFGDGNLYIEKCLDNPRHIEFQIMADTQGHVVHLHERECSIQRRHQKIIEETPSPAMTPALREIMAKAALSAARAAGYVNAGTVEFLLDASGQFYFLEVNTRLQVEHPITEMTTGLDLVRLQIETAAGRPLTLRQEEVLQRGHALECRIYAEDPEDHFFPSPGQVLFYREPSGPGVRNDSGIYEGFEIPVEYDPILSKLIVTAATREAARLRMIRALESFVILGVRTIVPFLIDILKSSGFTKGETFTDFIDEHFSNWKQGPEYSDLARIAYMVDEMSPRPRPARGRGAESTGFPSPWETLGDWKL
jgi:acetyl/propionyl-CoA carboxylase alpha subunit